MLPGHFAGGRIVLPCHKLLYDTSASGKRDLNGTPVADAHHFAGVEVFAMNAGDDVLDLTSGVGGGASYAQAATLGGGNGNDALWAGGGDDVIFGDTIGTVVGVDRQGGNDLLVGGAGNDTIYGDAGGLYFGAGGGDDLIDGGAGDDYLLGEANGFAGSRGVQGHNTFRFDGPGSGDDTIGRDAATGFQHGLDHIQLKASYGYATGAEALAHTTDSGGNAVVDLGHGDSITLQSVTTSQLDAGDFVIA